ncbi:hypothetical protein OQA88_12987 [Cercophora sp. LCS_1]
MLAQAELEKRNVDTEFQIIRTEAARAKEDAQREAAEIQDKATHILVVAKKDAEHMLAKAQLEKQKTETESQTIRTEAARAKDDAQREAAEIQATATHTLEVAKKDAEHMLAKAQLEKHKTETESEAIRAEAARIKEDAQRKATEIQATAIHALEVAKKDAEHMLAKAQLAKHKADTESQATRAEAARIKEDTEKEVADIQAKAARTLEVANKDAAAIQQNAVIQANLTRKAASDSSMDGAVELLDEATKDANEIRAAAQAEASEAKSQLAMANTHREIWEQVHKDSNGIAKELAKQVKTMGSFHDPVRIRAVETRVLKTLEGATKELGKDVKERLVDLCHQLTSVVKDNADKTRANAGHDITEKINERLAQLSITFKDVVGQARLRDDYIVKVARAAETHNDHTRQHMDQAVKTMGFRLDQNAKVTDSMSELVKAHGQLLKSSAEETKSSVEKVAELQSCHVNKAVEAVTSYKEHVDGCTQTIIKEVNLVGSASSNIKPLITEMTTQLKTQLQEQGEELKDIVQSHGQTAKDAIKSLDVGAERPTVSLPFDDLEDKEFLARFASLDLETVTRLQRLIAEMHGDRLESAAQPATPPPQVKDKRSMSTPGEERGTRKRSRNVVMDAPGDEEPLHHQFLRVRTQSAISILTRLKSVGPTEQKEPTSAVKLLFNHLAAADDTVNRIDSFMDKQKKEAWYCIRAVVGLWKSTEVTTADGRCNVACDPKAVCLQLKPCLETPGFWFYRTMGVESVGA